MRVAHRHPKIQGPGGCGQRFAQVGGASQKVAQAREIARRAGRGQKRAKDGRCPVLVQIPFLPAVGEGVAVGIGAAGRQLEGRADGQGFAAGRQAHAGHAVAGAAHGRARGGGQVVLNLLVAHHVEVGVGARLQVVAAADAGVGHYRRARTRLVSSAGVAIAGAAALAAVERVVAAKLVPHFVGHVVDIESIAHGVRNARFARRFQRGVAYYAHVGQPAAGRAEHVANVEVGRAHHRGQVALVLAHQVVGAVVGVGVGGGVGINQAAVVAHQLQAHGQLPLIHAGYPVHARQNCGLGAGHRAPAVGRVLGRGRHGQPVSAQAGAGGQQRAVRLASRAAGPGRGTPVQPRLPQAGRGRRQAGATVNIGPEKAEVVGDVAGPGRLQVHGPQRTRQNLPMKAVGRNIQPRRGIRVVQAAPGVGAQLGEGGRRSPIHNSRFPHSEAGATAIG